MTSLSFRFTLLSDVSFSESAATEGGHRTLHYIPGASLLGYCAQKLYREYAKSDLAFKVFHSGKVRFGNSYPSPDKENISFPFPNSWHLPKGISLGSKEGEKPFNKNFSDNEWDGIQDKQVKGGFVTAKGMLAEHKTTFRLKTAIDRGKGGRSAESQLFGYESMLAGAEFIGTVEIDLEGNEGNRVKADIEKVLSGTIRLGRSRGAEYGSVKVEPIDHAVEPPEPANLDDSLVVIYCMSDLILRDNYGFPILNPDADTFHLSNGAKPVEERTFVKTRRYAPFNGKRSRFDLERQIIAKGSVFVFTGVPSSELEHIAGVLAAGVGEYRQDGFGKVLVNPPFLKRGFSVSKPVLNPSTFKGRIDSALEEYLKARQKSHNRDMRALDIVEKLKGDIEKALRAGPSKSQWGQLRTIAMKCGTHEEISNALFGTKGGLCVSGVSAKQWGKKKPDKKTYSDCLQKIVLADKDDVELLRRILYQLGHDLPQMIQWQKQQAEEAKNG